MGTTSDPLPVPCVDRLSQLLQHAGHILYQQRRGFGQQLLIVHHSLEGASDVNDSLFPLFVDFNGRR